MPTTPPSSVALDYDVCVIGAGIGGLYALYRLRAAGFSVRACESGSDVGGVWYRNRYPGARFDSESHTYGYSFSEALLEEWRWRERFAAQPEILDYARYVADRFDLRRHIELDTRIVSARFDEREQSWEVETGRGRAIRVRYLVSAAGTLSVPQLPAIEGIESFAGVTAHTASWPRQGVPLAGKRVGVIGTASTGVQVIQTIASEVASLTVFQRTANWCMPQRNAPLSDEERRGMKQHGAEILERCRNTYSGFIHDFEAREGRGLSAEEREATFERLYSLPGFAFWLGNYSDLMSDPVVNRHACEFLAGKIRARVRDPETARKLIPDLPYGLKRVPLERGYFETYNRDNVRLIDVRETPIERVTPNGIRTTGETFELDVLIFATGFDAVTGALNRIDIRGENGEGLVDCWRTGAKTYLGLQVAGFPNFFVVTGPYGASTLCNSVRCIEQSVDWIADCIAWMREHGHRRIAPTPDAQERWVRHVLETAGSTFLATLTDGWFHDPARPGGLRPIAIYPGGIRAYRERCRQIARDGYTGFAVA